MIKLDYHQNNEYLTINIKMTNDFDTPNNVYHPYHYEPYDYNHKYDVYEGYNRDFGYGHEYGTGHGHNYSGTLFEN